MRLWMCLFILWLASACQADAGIRRWDALPAMDVMHLQGPYAGRTVCPMCQHGYDAGVLVFLPSTSNPESAARIAGQLRAAAARIDDRRFRPFLILTGATPSPRLLAAVEDSSPNWYVAHLPTEALPAASRAFGLPLAGRARGYVFAQRRLLLAFDPDSAESSREKSMDRFADYAMSFLRATYALPSTVETPDTPKGRLWLAPGTLSSTIAMAGSSNRATSRLCFADPSRSRRGDALVALTPIASAGSEHVWWARTDENGCVELSGAQTLPWLKAEVFSALQPVASEHIETTRLSPGTETVITIPAAAPVATRVTGNEAQVGLPCDGCEAVFTDLPTRILTTGQLAPPSEPGEPLRISGAVKNAAGIPQADVIVYAYQTDRDGRYPPAATRHGRLRGWARTDASGRYGFTTIRPGAYPDEDIPQHIHMHIIEPGRCTYWVGDILFTDDPLLTPARRLKERNARGGSGIVEPERSKLSDWTVTRDITLGLNVPGYRDCSHQELVMRISYVNVFVEDLDRAVRFYQGSLGLDLEFSSPEHGYASFRTGELRLGVAVPGADQKALIGRHTGVGFAVADLTAEHARLGSLGVGFAMPPTRQPWGGFIALFADVDGNVFYLDEVSAGHG